MMTSLNENEHTIAVSKLKLSSGAELAYRDSQPNGDAAALILLHGYCGSSAYWARIMPELSETMRVIAPDLRGHGQSEAPQDEVYTMELFAADIAELVERLKLQQVIMLGHSLGGYVSLAYAESGNNKLAAFGLIHSTPLPDSEAARENRDKAADAIQQNGIEPFVNGLIPKLFSPDNLVNHQSDIDQCKVIGYGTSQHGAIATAKGMKIRKDRSEVIRQSELPILLAAGAQDGVIPMESTFSADNVRTQKVELSSAGHMGMMEQPQQLVQAILQFIKSIDK